MSGMPVAVTCWSRSYARRGPVGGLDEVSIRFRAREASDAQFVIPTEVEQGGRLVRHPRLADLEADGARVTVDYLPAGGEMQRVSGAVVESTGEGDRRLFQRRFQIVSDFRDVFVDTIGWPNPTGSVTQQGQEGTHWRRTGPAETVLRDLVVAQTARLGKPIVCPPSQGRGATVRVEVRMVPLADRLFPLVHDAGILVDVVQRDAVRVLEVRTPTVFPRVLTERSDVLVTTALSVTPPTVTRVTVGAGGEGVAREFREYIDVSREAVLGRRLDRFVDARDLGSDFHQALDAQREARVELDRSAPKVRVATGRWIDTGRAVTRAQRTYDNAPAGAQKTAALDNLNEVKADLTTRLTEKTEAEQEQTAAQTAVDAATAAVVTARQQMVADMQARANEALAEGAGKVSLSLTLQESGFFAFGRTYLVGDRVSIQPRGITAPVSEQVLEVAVDWSAKAGLVVVPQVGQVDGSSNELVVRDVRRLQRESRVRGAA